MTDQHPGGPHGQQPYPYPQRPPVPYGGQPHPQQGHPAPPTGGQTYPPQQGYPVPGGQSHAPQGPPAPAAPPYPPQGYPPQGSPYEQGPLHQPSVPYGGQPGGPQAPPPHPGGQHGNQHGRPPAKKNTGRTVLFAALGLVLLLGLGGGTAWIVSGGFGTETGSGGGAADAGSGEWTVPFPDADSSNYDGSIAYGAWLGDSVAIRAQKDGVLAYDLKTGKRVWGTPSPGEQLCGATPETKDGRGAIAYGTVSSCDHLAGIDVKTGKLAWKTKIPVGESLGSSVAVPTLVLAGDVVVAKTDRGLNAYGLADGKQVWVGDPGSSCRADGLGGSAGQVVVTTSCGLSDYVSGLDPRTGKQKWSFKITSKGLGHPVLLADPAVVATSTGDSTTVNVVGRDGKASEFVVDARIDLLALNKETRVLGGYEQYRVAAHGNTLYLASFPENVPGKLRSRDFALAYDLATGKQLWKSTGTNDTMLNYIRADEHGLLALEVGDKRDLEPRLVRIDAATGKAAPVATLPRKYGHESERARVYEKNGTVVIIPAKSVTADYAVSAVRATTQ
ncbi:PQQ-binding-like beta-propeller repeat protein [Streptosporangium sp. CA-135522]|uniref:outer membrane protein assembly factor BamB family protein n=1 Tax=Streptosporangium sp. CA-135522 TaxID=3240072 RepID=UPI003D949BBD